MGLPVWWADDLTYYFATSWTLIRSLSRALRPWPRRSSDSDKRNALQSLLEHVVHYRCQLVQSRCWCLYLRFHHFLSYHPDCSLSSKATATTPLLSCLRLQWLYHDFGWRQVNLWFLLLVEVEEEVLSFRLVVEEAEEAEEEEEVVVVQEMWLLLSVYDAYGQFYGDAFPLEVAEGMW